MGSPEYRTTANMLAMLRLLENTHSGALPVNTIADELDVHRRTVVRWLLVLERELLGADDRPIVIREMRSGRAWGVLTDAQQPLSASIFQYAATAAATKHLAAGSSILAGGAADVLRRVEESLSPPMRKLVPRVTRAFHYVPFAPKDHSASEDRLDVLVQALIRQRRVEVDYRNMSGQESTQILEPWSMVMYRDGFYVLMRHIRGRTLRLYAVERMLDVRLDRNSSFEVPADFDPEAEFAQHMGIWRSNAEAERVVVAFEPGAGPSIRSRQWRGFVEYREAEDGRLHLVMDVPITPEICSWVLSWGAMAEVLEPAGLRAQVGAELASAGARYK